MGVVEGYTRSLDFSSYRDWKALEGLQGLGFRS